MNPKEPLRLCGPTTNRENKPATTQLRGILIAEASQTTAMRHVLMIAHDFPPEGKAGSYRPLRFARHLPELDWHPTVVTLDSENYERYDPSLLEQIPADIEIIRVPNRDPWL